MKIYTLMTMSKGVGVCSSYILWEPDDGSVRATLEEMITSTGRIAICASYTNVLSCFARIARKDGPSRRGGQV